MFLLDTDALSELEKPRPDSGLLAWLATVDWLNTKRFMQFHRARPQ